MNEQDYHTSFDTIVSPEEAFEKIGHVSKWWAKNFSGMSQKQGDQFTVRFGETYVNFTLSEVVPLKKVVWHVTDCNLHWIDDKKEWKDTDVVFELAPQKNSTHIDFTHVGLVPGAECYNDCETGWNKHVQTSLRTYLDEGHGFSE